MAKDDFSIRLREAMRTDLGMNGILNLDFMHYTTVVSLEMSDEPYNYGCIVVVLIEDLRCLGGGGYGCTVGGEVVGTGNEKIAHRIAF